ncbi:MAG: conjugal transfer protein TraF [Armatimonadetes bacterium]|nr:conjugal transfer protein TraF [Armatimonadota bacterium]
MMRSVSRWLTSFALLFVCGGAFAQNYDYTFGSDARAFAMGGAGLATTRTRNTNIQSFNPAALAFAPRGFSLYAPSFSFRADGAVSTGKAYSYLLDGADLGDTADLVRRFSEEDSVFGANSNIGFRYGAFELQVGAVAKARLLPNNLLTNWAQTGANLGNVPANGQADLLAAGYLTLPSLAYAIKLPMGAKKDEPTKGYDVSVGLRARFLQTYYTRYLVNQNAVLGNVDAIRAPELGGSDYLKDSGLAADIGFLFRPRAGKGVNAALVVSNFVKPGSSYRALNASIPNYNGRVGNGTEFDLLQTTLSAGAAYESGGLTLAADLMDVTSATRPVDLRFGAEQRIGRFFAARGGYSSNTGITFGAGLFGIDVAFGERLPLELNKTIRF